MRRLGGYAKGALGLSLLLVAAGCIATLGPFVPKPDHPANPVKYCNSAIGHVPGSKPWIQGGTCCCTPCDELMAQYHKDGFCQGLSKADLIKAYHDQGIALDLDHKGCNNMCDHGPHVVKGGKCMAPPTPGTANFEEVVSGVWAPPAPPQQKKSVWGKGSEQ